MPPKKQKNRKATASTNESVVVIASVPVDTFTSENYMVEIVANHRELSQQLNMLDSECKKKCEKNLLVLGYTVSGFKNKPLEQKRDADKENKKIEFNDKKNLIDQKYLNNGVNASVEVKSITFMDHTISLKVGNDKEGAKHILIGHGRSLGVKGEEELGNILEIVIRRGKFVGVREHCNGDAAVFKYNEEEMVIAFTNKKEIITAYYETNKERITSCKYKDLDAFLSGIQNAGA